MLTLHEVKTRFARAVLELASGQGADSDWTVGVVMDRTGLKEGQVRRAIKEFNLQEYDFDNFGYTGSSLSELEAFVSIEPEPAFHPLAEGRMSITYEQMKLAVAKALVSMKNDAAARRIVDEVAQRAGLHVGQVREILDDDFRLGFGTGGTFSWTQEQYESIEAYALNPVSRRPASVQSTTNNTFNNHGSNNNIQAAAGGDVTGNLHVTVTFDQVLNHLVRAVEASDMPSEKKTGIVTTLKSLLTEGALQGVKIGVADLLKVAYAHSGGIVALAETVDKAF